MAASPTCPKSVEAGWFLFCPACLFDASHGGLISIQPTPHVEPHLLSCLVSTRAPPPPNPRRQLLRSSIPTRWLHEDWLLGRGLRRRGLRGVAGLFCHHHPLSEEGRRLKHRRELGNHARQHHRGQGQGQGQGQGLATIPAPTGGATSPLSTSFLHRTCLHQVAMTASRRLLNRHQQQQEQQQQ